MIEMIVACATNSQQKLVIGRNGTLPWNIPEELRRFRNITSSHAVVMGRKTYESLPRKPLPDRTNIILSSRPDYPAPKCLVHSSIADVVAKYARSQSTCVVMGGQEIYRIFWPFCNTLHISRIDMLVNDGDAFFPFSWNDVELEFSPVSFMDRSSGGIQWKEYTYERKHH